MKDKLLNVLPYAAVALGLFVLIWAFFYFVVPSWFWHPLAPRVCAAAYHTPVQIRDCKSYNFWSSIAGSFLTSIPPWVIVISGWYWHNNCKKKGCPNIGFKHPEHGRPMCSIHVHETPHGFQKHHGCPELWKDARHHFVHPPPSS